MKAKSLFILLAIVSANCVAVTLEERIAQVETQIAGLLKCAKSAECGNGGCDMDEICSVGCVHCKDGCNGGTGGCGKCTKCDNR